MTESPINAGSLKPRIADGVVWRTAEDGREMLVGRAAWGYMDVRPGERPLVDRLDGLHTLDEITAEALTLPRPLRPLDVVGFLDRLHRAGLLEGLDEAAPALFGRPGLRRRAWFARLLRVRLPIPGTGALFAPFKGVAPGVFGALHVTAFAALFGGCLLAGEEALVTSLLRPVLPPRIAGPVELQFARLMLALSAIVSFRALLRGAHLTAVGLRVAGVGLQFVAGMPALEVDDRDYRAGSRRQRFHVAVAGLAGFAAPTAAALWLWITRGDDWAREAAFVGLMLLLLDTAPYLTGDARRLVGVWTRVPGARARAVAFLVRRVGKNLAGAAGPMSEVERRYLTIGVLWIAHALLAVSVVAGYLLPGTVNLLIAVASAGIDSAAALVIGALLLSVIVGVSVAFAAALAGLAVLMAARWLEAVRGPLRAKGEVTGDARAAEITEHAKRIPFLARLGDDALRTVAARMRLETYAPGRAIVRQGDPGDRFCYIRKGAARVETEDETGLIAVVARLQAGDFFGEVALLETDRRTASVIAETPVEVLALPRAEFTDLLTAAGVEPAEVLKDVRTAAFLRSIPLLSNIRGDVLGELVAAAVVETAAPGTDIVRQGETGEDVYLIRDGLCRVHLRDAEGNDREVAVLGQGDCFGEIAFLVRGPRTATVTTGAPVTLVRVPAAAGRRLLAGDFETALKLDRHRAERLDALLQTV